MIWLAGYCTVSLACLILGRGWQHKHPSAGEDLNSFENVTTVLFAASCWPSVLLFVLVVYLWTKFDEAIRWAVHYKPAPKPPRKMVEDPKAGYRDPGAR